MEVLPWLLGISADAWLHHAVILLVAAAPRALVISLPVAMAAGIASAGKRGILIKGGAHLEHLGLIKVVALDKTGTLTHGHPEVTDIIAFGRNEDELITLAAAIEKSSQHPLARAVVSHTSTARRDTPKADDFRAITGAGATAVITGERWYIGNRSLFTSLGIDTRHADTRIESLQGEGKTVMLPGTESGLSGLIAVQDTLREEAPVIIARLHTMGLRTVMLTGDNSRTAAVAAHEASELLAAANGLRAGRVEGHQS
ncbi:MAG TPA: cation-translocating P-type ATPase [Rhodobacteraceae bacterium]|nr:cation-translocating P-type ATPase [Paracoccaceae bacterium]